MKNQQLKALVQIAESGSIRAARVMNLCQSALTKSLRELEEEVGVELLLRSYKGIEFTDAGDILLLHDGHAARTTDGQPVILAMLPRLLATLNERQLKPVTLDAALK